MKEASTQIEAAAIDLRGYIDYWFSSFKAGKLTAQGAADYAKHMHSAVNRIERAALASSAEGQQK